MPGIFSPDNLPAWMNPTGFILESPSHVGEMFARSFDQAAENHSALNLLKIKEAQNNIALQNIQIKNTLADSTTIPQWMKDHPTWQSRQDSEWPTALTPEGQRTLQEQRLRDSQSIQAEVATAATHDFATRVAKLRDLDPEAAGQFAPYISSRPSPDILRALSIAEQTARLHQENINESQRMDAELAGAQVKTVTGPKGTTTTITPPKPGEDINVQPKTLDLGNGKTIAWMPGGKTLHVIDDKTKEKTELTVPQLQAVAKGLGDEDPRKAKITDFLAGAAIRQTEVTPSPPSAPLPTPTQPQPKKVLKYNPATGKIE